MKWVHDFLTKNSIFPDFEKTTEAFSPACMSLMPFSKICFQAFNSTESTFGTLESSSIDASIIVFFDTDFL